MAANKSAFEKIHWLNGRATGYYGPREYAEARVAEESNFTYYESGKLVTLDHDQSNAALDRLAPDLDQA